MYNERKAYIVLKSGSNTYPVALSSDPRAWLPNGAVATINEQLTIPSSVPTGTYQLYLHLPDRYPSLASNPAYAVRLANTGLWDATTGMNALNASVVVTAGGDDPQPIGPEGDAVVLPATLNKANVSAYSDDMTWYNNSAARIDSLRKKDFTLKAAPGAQVKVELMRHAFPFGTALALYPSKDSIETWYRKTANKYFWYGVPENQFKWPEYEPKKGKIRRDEFKQYLDYVDAYKWGFRAHTLVWGHQGYGFDKHFSNQGSCKDISNKIKARIDRDLKEYKGRIKEYDVWNEAFHEPFVFNKCGWDLLDSAHVWAHRADPDARLFINEYNVVAAGETERLYDIVKGMLDRKVPVHGIGVQCHFGDRQLNPNFIKQRLDRLGSLGLPIKVTELDFGDWQKGMYFGEEEQAKRYEMVLRIFFSHPSVEGILLWGFWDGRHWVKNGGIIAMDGREKPAAKLIYDLWHKVWTTNGTFKADANGEVKFRGYPGKYKVTIDGKSETVELK